MKIATAALDWVSERHVTAALTAFRPGITLYSCRVLASGPAAPSLAIVWAAMITQAVSARVSQEWTGSFELFVPDERDSLILPDGFDPPAPIEPDMELPVWPLVPPDTCS